MAAIIPVPDRLPHGSDLLADLRVQRALDVLNPEGEETRIVGGAVRNALLGLTPGDIDLATTMLPDAVLARAKRARIRSIPTGIDHGTVTLRVGDLALEVTTLREDVDTDGRHAVVRFGRDFEADAERRDFTINALSLAPDGTVFDSVGGLQDLAAGRVRFIGDAATRIREDFLRILRFFRFHAWYGRGPLDEAGLRAVAAERDGLQRLSRERVRTELLKLLGGVEVSPTVHAMAAAGILIPVLGAEADLAAFDAEVEAGMALDPILRLAAMAVRTPADVVRLRERLRLTNVEQARLLDMLEAGRAMSVLPDPPGLRRRLFEHGAAATADALRHGFALGLLPRNQAIWARAADDLQAMSRPVLPWSGSELQSAGLKGPRIGEALGMLRQRWADADFPNDDAALRRIWHEAVGEPDRPVGQGR